MKKQRKKTILTNQMGITLIALVVTIVVLLILASVTVNLLFTEDGIIKKVENAKFATKVAEYQDRMELSRVTVAIDNMGKVPIDKFIDQIKEDKIATDSQIKDNGDGSYTITPEDGIEIVVKPTDDGKNVEIQYPSTGTIGGGSGTGNTGGSGTGNTGESGTGNTGGEESDNTVLITDFTLNKTTATVKVGNTLTLVATVTPTDATNKTLTWISSETSVATVNNGVITPVAAGSTTITATTTDGSNISKTCSITIEYPALSELKIGDYVEYSANGWSSWRVLYPKNYETMRYDGTFITIPNVQIISTTSTEEFSITSKDATTAKNNYNNIVTTLNNQASLYVNTYATSARCFGTIPNNPSYDTNLVTSNGVSVRNGFEDNTVFYSTDMMQVLNNNLVTNGSMSWTTSRYKSSGDNTYGIWVWDGRNGGHGFDFFKLDSSGITANDAYCGGTANLIPIVSLKDTLTITGGDGTQSNPWKLGV